MGEIAEAMLEGLLDEETGELIDGDAPGYPRRMSEMGDTEQETPPKTDAQRARERRKKRRKKARRAAAAATIVALALWIAPASAQVTETWFFVNVGCRPVSELVPGAHTPADVLEALREEAPRSQYDPRSPYRPGAKGDQLVMIQSIGGYQALANSPGLCARLSRVRARQ
jgi:hypothetical protein